MRPVAVPLQLTREAARPREGRKVRLSGLTMGVAWTLDAVAPSGVGDEALRAAVQGACDRVVAQMSDWEPQSDLSRFNAARAGAWVSIPAEFAAVVGAAVALAEASGGAFDPTLGRLVHLWGFGPAGPVARVPDVGRLGNFALGIRALLEGARGCRSPAPGAAR